jgi:hypothetical protein
MLTWGVNNYDVYNKNDVLNEINYSFFRYFNHYLNLQFSYTTVLITGTQGVRLHTRSICSKKGKPDVSARNHN